MNNVVKVGVSGAAGQICYNLLFRLASGETFGPNTKVNLVLKEITPALKAATGVALELDDCAFPLLSSVTITDNDEVLCDGANWVILVGAAPRKAGMERSDLILTNGPIFQSVGNALNKAASDVQVLVVGNPCNTNALIAMKNSNVPADHFHAMMRLDENRMKIQLANKAGVPVSAVTHAVVWGNHSTTQYPNFHLARINGKIATEVINDHTWLESEFLTNVQNRGAEIIKARGFSSAASAANAAIDAVKALITPTNPTTGWFTSGVVSNGEYGIGEGIVYGFPCVSNGKKWKIVSDLKLDDYSKAKIAASSEELKKEREIVKHLL